jgi:hypothetical protein
MLEPQETPKCCVERVRNFSVLQQVVRTLDFRHHNAAGVFH